MVTASGKQKPDGVAMTLMASCYASVSSKAERKKYGIQLLPNTSLWLQAGKAQWEHNHLAVDNFRLTFPQTWEWIPRQARRVMCTYWSRTALYFSPPWIGVCPDLDIAHEIGRVNKNAIGVCFEAGQKLLFRSDVVAKLPPVPLAGLIAHELGHVFCFAKDRPGHWKETPKESAESEVMEVLEQWNLQQYDNALSDWLETNEKCRTAKR